MSIFCIYACDQIHSFFATTFFLIVFFFGAVACARGQQTKYALTFLKDMFKEGITPNRATYKAVFKACKATQDSETVSFPLFFVSVWYFRVERPLV